MVDLLIGRLIINAAKHVEVALKRVLDNVQIQHPHMEERNVKGKQNDLESVAPTHVQVLQIIIHL